MINAEQIKPLFEDGLEKQPETSINKGVKLDEIISKNNIEMDKAIIDMLTLVVKQNNFLSHLEVVSISPEEEPDTG